MKTCSKYKMRWSICALMCMMGTSLYAEEMPLDQVTMSAEVDSAKVECLVQTENPIEVSAEEPVAEAISTEAETAEALANTAVTSQEEPEKRMNIFRRFAKAFGARDPEYLDPMKYELVVRPQNVEFFQNYKVSVKDDEGNVQSLRMSPHHSVKFGVALGWRWLVLGYSVNVAKPLKDRQQFEFTFSLLSRMLSLDLLLINHKGGNFKVDSSKGFDTNLSKGAVLPGVKAFTAGANAYYMFNHARYSYTAAYSHSNLQKRSAGSWILGVQLNKQRLEMGDNPGLPTAFKDLKFDYAKYNITGGYGYNWVLAPNFMVSATVMPAIGFNQVTNEKATAGNVLNNFKRLNFDFQTRMGFVYNTGRWYTGAYATTNVYDYRFNKTSMSNVVNYLNIYVGMNFFKQKRYRD